MRKVVFLALLAATLPAVAAWAETPAEEQMAQRIGNEIKQSGQLHNYQITVKFQDGTAFLEGTIASVQQRTAAVQIAKHIKGVQRVQYKLEIPESDSSSDSKAKTGSDREQLADTLEHASRESSEREYPGVTQAYQQSGEPAGMPMQQQMMMSNRASAGMPMQRGNMPLPARMMPGMAAPGMMPVRQASAMGVNPASCSTCNGGPGMLAPGMGGGPGMGCGPGGAGAPMGFVPQGSGRGPSYDNAQMPGYSWPSYASYPNYAALTYPTQYSPTAWPYIGPFYPYPQVPLAWRKVSLEWDDGWWFLDFSAHNSSH